MPFKTKWEHWLVAGIFSLSMVSTVQSEEIKKLAADVQNPVSDLWRFGLINTNTFGAGRKNYDFYAFDLQGIWARQFGQWSVVHRLNVPLVYLPSSAPAAPSGDSGSTFGLGDIQYTAFIARDESKRFLKAIGGLGPTFLFNSATDDRLGTGKWAIGPSLALIFKPDPWVIGLVVTNLWSFAGDEQRESLNFLELRPFINYNVGKGWYLTSTPAIRAIWEADRRNRWTVPIGGGVGKVVLGVVKQPINLRLQAFYSVEKADFAPDWNLRFDFQILFPEDDPEPDS